ncbi:TPA: hypothetical protein ACQVSL_004846, partial [Serratia marcescens]
AVGKNGLMELKKNVIKKEDIIFNNRNYFIDMVEVSDDVSLLTVRGFIKQYIVVVGFIYSCRRI